MDGSGPLPGDSLGQEAYDQLQDPQGATFFSRMRQGVLCYGQDGRILDLNPAGALMLGISRESAIGAKLEAVGALLDESLTPLPTDRHPVVAALETGRAASGVAVVVTASGALRRLEIDAIPEMVRGALGVVCIFSDITEFNDTRERLDRVEKRIAESSRLYVSAMRELQARDRWVAIVSHDLRSPLSTAIAALRLARTGDVPLPVGPLNDGLAMAERAVHRGLKLVDDLLDIRRRDSGTFSIRPAEIDLLAFMSEVAAAHRVAVEKVGAALRLRVWSGAARSIIADADRLHQVFDNLIGNAVKNTSAGGVIRLSARASDDGVGITVTDSGTGMTDEQIASMLEWGWQAEGKDSRGFGIGLAVVDMIVAAHHGRLWARRRPAAGLSIRFMLPWAPPEATTPA